MCGAIKGFNYPVPAQEVLSQVLSEVKGNHFASEPNTHLQIARPSRRHVVGAAL